MYLLSIVDIWLWPTFLIVLVALLFLDLFVIHRKSKALSLKNAISWSLFWLALAIGFNYWLARSYGSNFGIQFATAYLVELSLSIDNLFVMLLVFRTFNVRDEYQHKVLFFGILGAMVFRTVILWGGIDLIHKFHWILYVFGVVLILSSLKFILERDEKSDIAQSWTVRKFKMIFSLSDNRETHKFFINEDGLRKVTLLLLALVVIEISDIMFAVDSIPAVLAISRDSFIAIGSNILALLGLRSLYFVLAHWIGRFKYLKPGLALVLAFVGFKMLFSDYLSIPSWVSLLVILMILTTAGLTSLRVRRKRLLSD